MYLLNHRCPEFRTFRYTELSVILKPQHMMRIHVDYPCSRLKPTKQTNVDFEHYAHLTAEYPALVLCLELRKD